MASSGMSHFLGVNRGRGTGHATGSRRGRYGEGAWEVALAVFWEGHLEMRSHPTAKAHGKIVPFTILLSTSLTAIGYEPVQPYVSLHLTTFSADQQRHD